MNGFNSFKRQRTNRNQRLRCKVNADDFRLRNKAAIKTKENNKSIINNILTRLSDIEKKLGLQLK